MRKTPPGVHRVRVGASAPPCWYIIWLGVPHAPGSVVLGRSKRLERHLWHRFFPEGGDWPREIRGWVNGVRWLLELHQGKVATSESCTMTETESVRERFRFGRRPPGPGAHGSLRLQLAGQELPRVTLPSWPPGLSSDTLGDSTVAAMSHMLAAMAEELGELSEEQVLEAYRKATGLRPDPS
jgi:hypothetical protein